MGKQKQINAFGARLGTLALKPKSVRDLTFGHQFTIDHIENFSDLYIDNTTYVEIAIALYSAFIKYGGKESSLKLSQSKPCEVVFKLKEFLDIKAPKWSLFNDGQDVVYAEMEYISDMQCDCICFRLLHDLVQSCTKKVGDAWVALFAHLLRTLKCMDYEDCKRGIFQEEYDNMVDADDIPIDEDYTALINYYKDGDPNLFLTRILTNKMKEEDAVAILNKQKHKWSKETISWYQSILSIIKMGKALHEYEVVRSDEECRLDFGMRIVWDTKDMLFEQVCQNIDWAAENGTAQVYALKMDERYTIDELKVNWICITNVFKQTDDHLKTLKTYERIRTKTNIIANV